MNLIDWVAVVSLNLFMLEHPVLSFEIHCFVSIHSSFNVKFTVVTL